MTRTSIVALAVGLVLMPLAAAPLAAPLAAQTSVTIYNDGRVLVRRAVAAKVPKGASSQQVSLGAIDPSTLISLDSNVVVTRTLYDGAVDEMSVLRRSIGRRIVFRIPETRDTVSALVLGVDPLRLQLADGRVSFSMPGLALYPADVAVVDPLATLALDSKRAVDQLRLAYFTTGAAWQASYDVTLGAPGQARVNGVAVLSSSTLRADDAEVQLLAGSVNRARPEQPQRYMEDRLVSAQSMKAGNDAFAGEERVGEFHVYSLPGRATLMPGLTSSIALFAPAQVPAEKRYVVRGMIPYWGFIPQQGEEAEAPVEVRYTLKRPRKTEFGDRPMPQGVARVYQADSANRPQLVGEAWVKHTAAGHDLELAAGNAFDLTAQRVQVSYTTRRESNRDNARTILTAEYRVTLRNETDAAVTIDVLEERHGEWRIIASSIPAEKVSSTITRFRVPVPAQGETVLTYTIEAVW